MAPAPPRGIKWLPWGELVSKGSLLVVLKMQCFFFGLALRNSFDLLAEGFPQCLVLAEVAELQLSKEQLLMELYNGRQW